MQFVVHLVRPQRYHQSLVLVFKISRDKALCIIDSLVCTPEALVVLPKACAEEVVDRLLVIARSSEDI